MTDYDKIAKALETAAGPERGYAAFIDMGDGTWTYLSNRERASIVEVLGEWLQRSTPTGPALNVKPRPETTDQVDGRLALERHCAEMGKLIGEKTGVLLFLFQDKNLAYISTRPNCHSLVAQWLQRQKNRKN